MNALNVCLTITSLAGIVNCQGTYSLIPNMNPNPSKTFSEDVGSALQNAAKHKMESTEMISDSHDTISATVGGHRGNLQEAFRELTHFLEKYQQDTSTKELLSASHQKISNTSTIKESHESNQMNNNN